MIMWTTLLTVYLQSSRKRESCANICETAGVGHVVWGRETYQKKKKMGKLEISKKLFFGLLSLTIDSLFIENNDGLFLFSLSSSDLKLFRYADKNIRHNTGLLF